MYIVLDSGQLITGRLPAYFPPRYRCDIHSRPYGPEAGGRDGSRLRLWTGTAYSKGVRGSDGPTPRGGRVLTRVLSVCRMVRSRAAAG